jgi:hypothetical protein
VLCKDRVFEPFRSLYTQRPTQSSVLRRSLDFNAEVAKYARISRNANRNHNMLAQEGNVERIPGLSAHCVIKAPSTNPDCCITITGGKVLTLFRPRRLRSSLLFFQDERACSCSAEGCQCLTNVRGSYVTIERYSHRHFIK